MLERSPGFEVLKVPTTVEEEEVAAAKVATKRQRRPAATKKAIEARSKNAKAKKPTIEEVHAELEEGIATALHEDIAKEAAAGAALDRELEQSITDALTKTKPKDVWEELREEKRLRRENPTPVTDAMAEENLKKVKQQLHQADHTLEAGIAEALRKNETPALDPHFEVVMAKSSPKKRGFFSWLFRK